MIIMMIMNGLWRAADQNAHRQEAINLIYFLHSKVGFRPLPRIGKFFVHVPRGQNRRADALANAAMDQKAAISRWDSVGLLEFMRRFQPNAQPGNDLLHVRFDGGFRTEEQIGGTGFCMELVNFTDRIQILQAGTVENCTDSYAVEAKASFHAVRAVVELLAKVMEPE